MLAKKTERNMGIELLRIVSMVMIVILHGLSHGGVREGTQGLGIHEQLAWLLTALCFGAVLLYALITGYLYMSVKHRWYRFGELWLQVLFYSVGVYLLLSFTSGSCCCAVCRGQAPNIGIFPPISPCSSSSPL